MTDVSGGPDQPRLGLAVSTIGREALTALLRSAAGSTRPPDVVVLADQSGSLELETLLPLDLPFPVVVVPSSGGVSLGRNAAAAELVGAVDVVGFPNDDTTYPPELLERVCEAFSHDDAPGAVACALVDVDRPRYRMPHAGAALSRRTVWRAVEPAVFVSGALLRDVGGFRADLGSGAGTPWGSGEGTDLLLRAMDAGHRVVSRPDLHVFGPGERRDLDEDRLVAKQRAYNRGTGYVYRIHGYPLHHRLRTLAGPLVKFALHDPSLRLSLRLARARFRGRLEGLRGSARQQGAWDPRSAVGEGPRHEGPVRLGAVVPTVGRTGPLLALLSSLERCAAAGVPLQVVVVAQGPLDLDPQEFGQLDLVVHHDDGRGASRARNLGLTLLADDVTHVLWPNDHTEYGVDGLRTAARLANSADVVVGELLEAGRARYPVPSGRSRLTHSNVWTAIEPATAVSVSAVRAAGGWDESLGTGAASPWQSSALADLLLRVAERPGGAVAAWSAGFTCTGQGFVRGLTGAGLEAKARTYGRGYGFVLRRWDYPRHRLVGSVLKPVVQPRFGVGVDELPYLARVQLALGRLEGVLGRLLPTSRTELRRREDLQR